MVNGYHNVTDDSSFLYKTGCPKCGSRDNLAVYSDGGQHCFGFGCNYHVKGTEDTSDSSGNTEVISEDTKESLREFLRGEYRALKKRAITEETCRRWGYTVGRAKHPKTREYTSCHIEPYYSDDGELVAQKLRFPDKEFKCIGKPQGLAGKNLCNPSRFLVITEGFIDAMSYSQAVNYKYPVVSIPNGAQSAKKVIQKELKWLEENFEKIVLMFDSDQVGQDAARECASLFSPNKCLIAKLSEKDANDMLLAGKIDELISAVFRAKTYRPEAIVPGSEVWELVSENKNTHDALYPYTFINEITYGLRLGELVTICAGSGIGKSQFCREIAYNIVKQGDAIGYIALEESVRRTALGIMSIEAEKPLHLSLDGVTNEFLKEIYDKSLADNKVYFYDHFGSLSSESLLNHIRFLARSCEVKWIILDHISIVVSGISEGDERRIIDNLSTALRSLAEELRIGIIMISHLKRPDGKGHEEGHEVSLAQLRGSSSIAQLSDIVIGLERNQQDSNNMHLTTVRILKNRYTGQTGIAGYLEYSPITGRLLETDKKPIKDKHSFKPVEDDIEDY